MELNSMVFNISKAVEKIVMQVQENQEEFIFETIRPYCENILQMKINKEELKQILLNSMQRQDIGKWIPCSERLPEDSELVLFSTKTDEVFEGRYFDDNTNHQWYSFRDDIFAWNNIVTAWMPLPPCYKPQESEDEDVNK